MIWTKEDGKAVRDVRRCLDQCRERHVVPAPWFPLVLRMYEALEGAGMLERQDMQKDVCHGCADSVYGGCRNGYAGAVLNQDRSRVTACSRKRVKECAK